MHVFLTMKQDSHEPDACYCCGRRAGYNRAIVDRHLDARVGRLCMNCERDELGTSFADGYTKDDDTCALCDRDSQYVLPRYEPVAVEGETAIVSRVSATADQTPLPLCDEHLHEFGDRPTSRPEVPLRNTGVIR